MSIENIKKKLKQNSKKDTTWIEQAEWRKANEKWLDISFKLAVKIRTALEENKQINRAPKSQKALAEQMNCSPQYINKVLKGQENLQLETIAKLSTILNISLIEVSHTRRINDVEKMTRKNLHG